MPFSDRHDPLVPGDHARSGFRDAAHAGTMHRRAAPARTHSVITDDARD